MLPPPPPPPGVQELSDLQGLMSVLVISKDCLCGTGQMESGAKSQDADTGRPRADIDRHHAATVSRGSSETPVLTFPDGVVLSQPFLAMAGTCLREAAGF